MGFLPSPPACAKSIVPEVQSNLALRSSGLARFWRGSSGHLIDERVLPLLRTSNIDGENVQMAASY